MIKRIKNFFAKKEGIEYSVALVMGDGLLSGINPDEATLSEYEKMRYDEQVNVCLEVRTQAMLGKGWTIQAPEGQEELAEEIESNLNNLKGSFYQTLKRIELPKKVFGFSLSEILWQGDNGKLKIAGIKTRDSQMIKFYPDKYGDLHEDGIRQEVETGEIYLPEEKMILHINNMENANYFGISDLKPAFDGYKNKDKIKRFYNILLERFGIPPIIATYDPNTLSGKTEEQIKDQLQKTAASLKKSHQGGIILIPNTYDSEVIKLDGSSGDAFEKALDRYDFAISKALKVPSELGFLNVKVGSNAKASTQYDVFLMVVNQDKVDLEETVNEQLIKRYVMYNYGPQSEYPKLKFNPTDGEDIEKIIKLYNEARKAGAVRVTKEIEAKILLLLGFPEVNEDDLLDISPEKENDSEESKNNKENDKEKFAKRSYNGWELEGPQLKVNFAKIGNFFEEKEITVMVRIEDVVDEIFIDISNKVSNKKIIPEKKFEDIENLQIKGSFVGAIKSVFQKYLKQAAKEGKISFLEEMKPEKFSLPGNELLEPEYLTYITTLSKEIAGELAGLYLVETKKTLLMGIQNGWSEKKTMQALQEVYSVSKLPGHINTPAVTENRLRTIVRTNLNAAFNRGRHIQAIQLNAKTKDVYYKQFVEVLDDRSHPFSQYIHGKSVRVGTELDQRLSYPFHFNDRGVAVYINAAIEGEPANILKAMPNLSAYSGLLIS